MHGKVLLCHEYELNIHIISGSRLRTAQRTNLYHKLNNYGGHGSQLVYVQ